MIGSAENLALETPLPDGVDLRQVRNAADVDGFCRLQAVVFEIEAEPMKEHLLVRLAVDEQMELWVAESDGQMISAGRLEPVGDTDFVGIWGGLALQGWRGRGIYRALTAARARSALPRGKTLIHSDSTDYSRPILERYGFTKVSTTTPDTTDVRSSINNRRGPPVRYACTMSSRRR